jgi:hypothetical protein
VTSNRSVTTIDNMLLHQCVLQRSQRHAVCLAARTPLRSPQVRSGPRHSPQSARLVNMSAQPGYPHLSIQLCFCKVRCCLCVSLKSAFWPASSSLAP